MNQLLPHQERVVNELSTVVEMSGKLSTFIEGQEELEQSNVSEHAMYLLRRQLATMEDYKTILEARIRDFQGSRRYACHMEVWARPMNRADYNTLRGWSIPPNEQADDEGYFVERISNEHQPVALNFADHITWVPKAVFERDYAEQYL
jgi:hypothetical protein